MKNNPEDLILKTGGFINIVLVSGITLILLVSIYCSCGKFPVNISSVISTFGCGLLIGGAAFAAGGFGGFIFGIPSLMQNKESDKSIVLKYNDNLIQISDWLTKIIVGVGLIQLNKIPGKIQQLGDQLKSNFGNDNWGANTSLALVLYFFLFGFLITYFWTRTDFTTIIKKTDDDLQKRYEKAEEDKLKLEKVADSAVAEKNKGNIDKSLSASIAPQVNDLKDDASEAFNTDLEALKEKVKEVLKGKQITNAEDTQKGRWGGKKKVDGKEILCNVNRNVDSFFYDVTVNIVNNNSKNEPVAVFIDQSFDFPDNVIYLKPNSEGISQVVLVAYEAFTIGAYFLDGTELEIDLNDEVGYPKGFYWH